MKPFTKPFQQLRWKLALSYAGVTILALLTVELLLFAAMSVGVTVFLSSGAIPKQLIEKVSIDYVTSPRPYLSESPPNLRGIADVLALAEAATARTIPLSFDVQDFLVIDDDRTLVGSSPPDMLGENSLGQPLDLDSLPELAAPLQTALAGEEDIEKLYVVGEPGGIVVFAVPVREVDQQTVLGVFVGLTESPTAFSLLGEAAPIAGISLLIFTAIAGIAGIAYGLLAAHGPVERIERLATTSEAWGQGDFSAVAEDSESDELGELAQRLNQMALRLEQLFELRQDLAVLKERNRLARDLHDSVKQLAFATAAQIGTARTLITQDPAAASRHIEEAERLTHELRQELSSLILELAPPALDDKGLVVALREYSQRWSRQNNIEVVIRVEGERRLPLNIGETIFRITQEALANTARHSDAQRVDIKLTYAENSIRCLIEDDGVGFDPGGNKGGFGLRSMAARAGALGGDLAVTSVIDGGTVVSAKLPVGESKDDLEGKDDG